MDSDQIEGMRKAVAINRSLLGLPPQEQLNGWQFIDTAPKDGTPILGFVDKVMYVCWWDGLGWSFFVDGRGSRFAFFPTHWMPLPMPPEV